MKNEEFPLKIGNWEIWELILPSFFLKPVNFISIYFGKIGKFSLKQKKFKKKKKSIK